MSFCGEKEYESFGVAYLVSKDSQISIARNGKTNKGWNKLSLEFKQGDFVDYMSNELGGRLCSLRLKEIIKSKKTSHDVIEWLPVEIIKGKEARDYYFLCFPENVDVLDSNRSSRVDSLIIKPFFDKEKIKNHAIFGLPDEDSHRTYVSNDMREAIEDAGITGISFTGHSCL